MDWLWIILGILLIIIIYFAFQLRRTPDRKTSETSRDIKINAGFLSPHMTTNDSQTEAVYEHAYVLIADQTIEDVNEIVPVLEKVLLKKQPLLVIAQKIEEEVLSTLVVNKIKGQLETVAVQAPEGDQFRQVFLQDIAAATGGQMVKAKTSFKKVKITDLGLAQKVIVTKESTQIFS